jgi:hypothetical protein
MGFGEFEVVSGMWGHHLRKLVEQCDENGRMRAEVKILEKKCGWICEQTQGSWVASILVAWRGLAFSLREMKGVRMPSM